MSYIVRAMIKVHVVRGFQTGLPLASSLLAIGGGLTGCADAADATTEVASDESAYTVADPGTGVFELGWAHSTSSGYAFTAKNSTDEYVRVQEKMTFTIPVYFLWQQLHPSERMPNDLERLKQLSAKVVVSYLKNGASYAGTTLFTSDWLGDQSSNLRATTPTFVVDKKAQAMRFALEIKDSGVSGAPLTRLFDENSFYTQAVIGGTVPDKTLLFDTNGLSMRARILEGGKPVQGAELAIAYTDWRASTLVDASKIDREIGTQQSFGRFGPSEIPIYGEIVHEVSYAVAVDGRWQQEQTLIPNGRSRLLPANRLAYEGNVSIPGSARNVEIYFHVRTFLKADYSRFSNIRHKKYADGARVLMREKWDNKEGSPNQNYAFATEAL
jgi:hypothetical protein